jgi:hypothetical protein
LSLKIPHTQQNMAQEQDRDIYTHRLLNNLRSTPRNAPQTLEEAGRDSTRPEGNEFDRVRVTNKYAMDMASKLTYGLLYSSKRQARIEMWIERMPYDWQFENAGTARPATIIVYTDWLNWQKCNVHSWLCKLDEFERRYRIAGVKYHKIAHPLRHSMTLPHGPKIDQQILKRLTHIFETDRSRDDQTFFAPWMDVYNGVIEVLDDIEAWAVPSKTIEQLRKLEDRCCVALEKLSKPMRSVEAGVLWLEGEVVKLAERSDQDASESLLVKHSREGSLFRRWIQTFLEIEHGVVWNKSEYTEQYVDKMVSGEVEKELYWSMLVEANKRTADSMEEN